MPILKQLVSSSTQAKRRSRADLTAEMISAPLGDFRHTMHVGRGGDAFGDTSFLSSRSVEPPRDVPPRDVHAEQDSPRQGLLARTFRSSRRSLSSSRTDKPDNPKHTPPGGSPSYVKNAVSLPYLNDNDAGHTRGPGLCLPKSVSSSPARQLPDGSPKPANGPTPTTAWDLELTEREFGEPTELPLSSAAPRGGMKHAESVLSFHIDLGPSMLGDILSVMDRKGDTDLGYDEEPDSLRSYPLNEPAEEAEPPVRPPRQTHTPTSPYTPEVHSQVTLQHPGRYCVSSSRSTEDRPQNHAPPTACVNHAPLAGRDDRDFSFMDDDDDDEIRV